MPCTAEYFLDAIGIGHEDLYASWRNAHKRQAFGAPFSESLKFLDVRNWPKVTSTVRAAFNDVKLAHGASQRLGADLIDVIGGLDGDDFSSIAPKYASIIERARGDPGFAVLCNPVRTEALRAVFPSDESATRDVWHGSSENVRASIASKPPPDVPGGLGLEQIEQATIDAARAAFGRVVHRRKGTRFGADYVAALRWLRDSVIWVIGKMWKHVKSFAFVAAMIFAVVLTYCMFMDREYTTHLAVATVGFKETKFEETFVPVYATTEETQTRAGIDGREYGAGVCAVIYTGMDCIVRMALDSGYAGLARTLDTFFGAGSTKKGHEALAQWAAIDIAEKKRTIGAADADKRRSDLATTDGASIYAVIMKQDKQNVIANVDMKEFNAEKLRSLYDRNRSSVAEIQRQFAAAQQAAFAALQRQQREAAEIRERAEAAAKYDVEKLQTAAQQAQQETASANQRATQAEQTTATALHEAGNAIERADTAVLQAQQAQLALEAKEKQAQLALEAKEKLLLQNQKEINKLNEGWVEWGMKGIVNSFIGGTLSEFGTAARSASSVSFDAEIDASMTDGPKSTWSGGVNPKGQLFGVTSMRAAEYGAYLTPHFGDGAAAASASSLPFDTSWLPEGYDARHAGAALGSIILLGYLLGPVVTASLVLALGAGLFAHHLLSPAGGGGNMAAMQAVVIGATVFTGLIQLMPVSSNEADTMQALTGMVLHTTSHLSDYRAQKAKAEADLMRARDAASTATYASVAGGLTGVAALALTNDATAAASLAGAVHTGVADTGRSVSEANAVLHEYNARFGDFYV
jgi:hypothetical protein